MKTYTKLALIAADQDDLQTMSALLQDAVLKIGDAAYVESNRRFAFVTNRYLWELAQKNPFGSGYRVRAGVHFDDVQAVRVKNVRLDAKDAVVKILNTAYVGSEDGGTITITLSGGGVIALDVEAINATLQDLSEPWRASRKPKHEGV
ncbi:MAG: DUF2948 family protein [Pseudomonadota bacterium]